MIVARNGQIATETGHDHEQRPECLKVKLRHNRHNRDGAVLQAGRRCHLAAARTMYLEESAIEETLSVTGGFAPGSEIIVDYMLPAGLRDAAGDRYAEQVGQACAERGEPWLSLFAPEDMAALLRRHGFGPVRDVRQHDMIPAPLWDRTDSLRPADLSRIAHSALPSR